MLKIAICDDEQPIKNTKAGKEMYGGNPTVCRVERTVSGSDGVDLILLDISLNREQNAAEPDGMETARKIRERMVGCMIIFVTYPREYVFERL